MQRLIPLMSMPMLAMPALAAAATPTTAPAPASAGSASPTLLRASLLVEDADRAQAFYAALGFRPETDFANPREPAGNPFPLNAPSTAVRLVVLASASGDGGRIGLVQFTAPTPADNRRDAAKTGRGDVVLVFDVADADATHAALVAAGAQVLEPPQVYVSRRSAPDGSPMQGKVFHARDPDGHLVELLEAPKPVR
ncbi:MAG: VOC family protein [Gammaproteobacteria bacterium]|nr:VOC family protein [Gammaproteobacteria bacterium]